MRSLTDSIIKGISSRLPIKKAIAVLQVSSIVKSTLQYRDPWFFQQVFLEIQTRCNRSCWYCPEKFKSGESMEMSVGMVLLCLQRLEEINWRGPVAYHIYNEPCKDQRLPMIVRETKKYLPHSKPILFTNGDYLTPQLTDELIQAGLVRCTITRHPPFNNNWDKKIDAIVARHPRVFRKHEITEEHIINVGGFIPEASDQMFKICHAPTLAMPIRYNGDVGPCCCDYNRTVVLGNVKSQSLKEIWQTYRQQRAALRTGEKPWGICDNCSKVAMTWVDKVKLK